MWKPCFQCERLYIRWRHNLITIGYTYILYRIVRRDFWQRNQLYLVHTTMKNAHIWHKPYTILQYMEYWSTEVWLLQHCSSTYEVLSTQVLQVLVPGIRYILPTPVTTAFILEYCLLFTMHSENCFFLGGFRSSQIVVSSAASAVLTLVNGRAAGCGEGGTAPALNLSSWRDDEKTQYFLLCNLAFRKARRQTSSNTFVDRVVIEYYTLHCWSTQIRSSVERRKDRNEHM